MMYSEFLEISGKPEKYISFVEYTSLIEPIYMDCELSKKDFIAVMEEGFDKIVYPAVDKAISALTLGLYVMFTRKMIIVNDYWWKHNGLNQWEGR